MTRRGENQPTVRPGAPASEAEGHHIHLCGGQHAASGARAAIDILSADVFDDHGCEDMRLMVSELVANSVRHGGARTGRDSIDLTVFVRTSLMRVECSDPVGGFEVPASPDGYGLSIIDLLSSDWGVRYGSAGSVWFEYSRNGSD